MVMQSINPATEKVITTYTEHTKKEVEDAITLAHNAFQQHRLSSFQDRRDKMETAAQILDDEKEKWATLLTQEMGKTFKSAIAEVEKCAWVCRHYAEQAETIMKDEVIQTEASNSYVKHLPIGIVLAVMPNVPGSALAIEEVFSRAGFEKGCFQTLLIGSDKVEAILKDDRVRAATLTGSEPAGRAVAATCGSEIKTTVLELGGSDAFIVMPSADMEQSINKAVTGRTMNNGQSCIAAKRLIIHCDIYDEFKDKLVARFNSLKVGDPMKPETDIGPLALKQIRDELDEQVKKSVQDGATLLCGGEVPEGDGYFYTPAILANIPKDALAYSEELFGPVASIYKVASLEEAIELANDTRFGLGSAIMTHDENDIEIACRDLDAGSTFVNSNVASDPRLPFGGVKSSGYGRELSKDGLLEFTNRKTISISRGI